MSDHAKVIAAESGGDDAFDRAAKVEPPPLKSPFVSTGTVEVGEGIQFELASAEMVADPFNEGLKVVDVKGQVIESRAEGLIDQGEITVSCRAERLEQFGNAVMAEADVGAVVTLIRGEDEGKKAGWRWMIDHPETGEFALAASSVTEDEEPDEEEPPS